LQVDATGIETTNQDSIEFKAQFITQALVYIAVYHAKLFSLAWITFYCRLRLKKEWELDEKHARLQGPAEMTISSPASSKRQQINAMPMALLLLFRHFPINRPPTQLLSNPTSSLLLVVVLQLLVLVVVLQLLVLVSHRAPDTGVRGGLL
jgi:hypothetical protein